MYDLTTSLIVIREVRSLQRIEVTCALGKRLRKP